MSAWNCDAHSLPSAHSSSTHHCAGAENRTGVAFPVVTVLAYEILQFQIWCISPHCSLNSYHLGKSTSPDSGSIPSTWREHRCASRANPDSVAQPLGRAVPEESGPKNWRRNTSAIRGILCCCKRWQLNFNKLKKGPDSMLLCRANYRRVICFFGLLTTKVSQKYF